VDLLANLAKGFGYIFGFQQIFIIIIGVILGILGGAMPGLSPSMAVALLVPFTYKMSPMLAIILLASIYLAANYGGSITAVTINTPGTPAAAVTAIDGYQLTRMGKPGKGLGTSLVASTIGGIIGVFILIFFSVPLAKVAVRIHPAEYFALAMFGLTPKSLEREVSRVLPHLRLPTAAPLAGHLFHFLHWVFRGVQQMLF